MKIYLIGFMGAGKSHVGRQLSKKMQLPFIDLDNYIEKKEQQSISEIFATKGERTFRQLEQQYLLELTQLDSAIIATGGGTPCFFKNIQKMNQNGLTIYLKTPVPILVERLIQETTHRPLLAGKTKVELANFIEKKLLERAIFYEKASVIFEVKKKEENVSDILFKILLDS